MSNWKKSGNTLFLYFIPVDSNLCPLFLKSLEFLAQLNLLREALLVIPLGLDATQLLRFLGSHLEDFRMEN